MILIEKDFFFFNWLSLAHLVVYLNPTTSPKQKLLTKRNNSCFPILIFYPYTFFLLVFNIFNYGSINYKQCFKIKILPSNYIMHRHSSAICFSLKFCIIQLYSHILVNPVFKFRLIFFI